MLGHLWKGDVKPCVWNEEEEEEEVEDCVTDVLGRRGGEPGLYTCRSRKFEGPGTILRGKSIVNMIGAPAIVSRRRTVLRTP